MENLTYETKCRKCSTITEFSFCDSDEPTMQQKNNFHQLMNIYLRSAPLLPCPKCGIFTIQEVVSYSRPESTKEDFELTQSQKDLIEKCNLKP